jgi:hypothetical protein
MEDGIPCNPGTDQLPTSQRTKILPKCLYITKNFSKNHAQSNHYIILTKKILIKIPKKSKYASW